MVSHDGDLEIKQINLVLRLQHSDLLCFPFKFDLSLLKLLDLVLGCDPVALDFLSLPGDRLELLFHKHLLARDLLELQAQLATKVLVLAHLLLLLLQLVLHHG